MLPSDAKEWALLVVGVVAGYYVVSHFRKTGQAA